MEADFFSDENRAQLYAEHLAKQPPKPPDAKSKAVILLEVVAEFPDLTVKELASASGMSNSWVRKHLRLAGVTLTKTKAAKP